MSSVPCLASLFASFLVARSARPRAIKRRAADSREADGRRKRNNEKCPRTVLRRPETKGARQGNGTQRTGRHPRVGGAGKGDCGPGSREERSCERGKRAISSNTSTQEETTRPRSVSKGSALESAKRINFTHGRSIGTSKVRCRTLRCTSCDVTAQKTLGPS